MQPCGSSTSSPSRSARSSPSAGSAARPLAAATATRVRSACATGPSMDCPAGSPTAGCSPSSSSRPPALLLITAVAFALVPGSAGTATVWFLASYAVVRFGLQRLRADYPDPVAERARGTAHVRAPARGGSRGGPLVAAPRTGSSQATVVAGVLLSSPSGAGCGLSTSRRRPASGHARTSRRGVGDRHRAVTSASRRHPGGEHLPRSATTSHGMVVAVSPSGGGSHVSLSHPSLDTLRRGARPRPAAPAHPQRYRAPVPGRPSGRRGPTHRSDYFTRSTSDQSFLALPRGGRTPLSAAACETCYRF